MYSSPLNTYLKIARIPENCSFTPNVCIIVSNYNALVSIGIVYCLHLDGSPYTRRCRLAEGKSNKIFKSTLTKYVSIRPQIK